MKQSKQNKQNHKQDKKIQNLCLGIAAVFAGAVLCTSAVAGVIDFSRPVPVQAAPDANPSTDSFHVRPVHGSVLVALDAESKGVPIADIVELNRAQEDAQYNPTEVSVKRYIDFRNQLAAGRPLVPDTSASGGGIDLYQTSIDPLDSWFEIDPSYNLSSDEVASWQALETWTPRLAKADLTAKILRHNARVESMQSTEVDQLQKIGMLLTAICASDTHCKIAHAGL